jgi:hypothetical protein
MRPLRNDAPGPNDNADQQHAGVGANETPVTGNAARPDPGPMSYGLLSSCDSRDPAVLGDELRCRCGRHAVGAAVPGDQHQCGPRESWPRSGWA